MAKKITLIFSTNAGDLEEEFSLEQPLHAVKREVMAKLKLDPSQADEFIVTLDGNPLDESKKLGDLDIPDKSVLVIERKELVKI